jgi:hypothetical protein
MRRILLAIPLLVLLFAAPAYAESDGLPEVVTDINKAFVKGSLVVKGEGGAPADPGLSSVQKRILALRAAKVTALRETAEILNGVTVSGETLVENAAAASDTVRSTVQGIIKGAQVIKEVYDPLSELGVIYITVPLTGPNGVLAALLPKVIPMMPPEMGAAFAPPAGFAVDENYDGLIVDVRELAFKPALINRVVTTNNSVVYDPSSVESAVLGERGAAEYTDDIGKAKALLAERGSKNPLVVKAEALVRSTDVEVGEESAAAISASNQTNKFLENARVVFVLK